MAQKNKKINYIIGLGKSGFWAAIYLKSLGKNVTVLEDKTSELLENRKKELETFEIKVILNKPFEYKEFSNSIDDI